MFSFSLAFDSASTEQRVLGAESKRFNYTDGQSKNVKKQFGKASRATFYNLYTRESLAD